MVKQKSVYVNTKLLDCQADHKLVVQGQHRYGIGRSVDGHDLPGILFRFRDQLCSGFVSAVGEHEPWTVLSMKSEQSG
jgi:hypothetical protein